ncbi:MAG: alkaline phosphatase family protein [Myxococcales bacterium]
MATRTDVLGLAITTALAAMLGSCATPAAVPRVLQAPVSEQRPPEPPKLIVQVTVDQLRTDLLTRYADRFVAGGLRRFLDDGLFFHNAHYAHAITETAVGHATLFTGALPSMHGIVGNEWLEAGHKRTSVEDARYPLLGAAKPAAGASPDALRVSTLGDQLELASDGAALVFSVSIKDRAAILPAGHAGKAFWYEEASGRYVTSSYYYPELPGWLGTFLAHDPLARFPLQWSLLLPPESYRNRARDARPFEKALHAADGTAFPHTLTGTEPRVRYSAIKHSPFGDELTLDLVTALLEAEPLGRDDATDLLAISFSSTDIVGHAFGPESLEAEDNLVRLDRVIARLFDLLLQRVEEQRLVVALSADHGISETPEHLLSLGLPAGRHPAGTQLVQELNSQLVAQLGASGDFVSAFANPCLWLDEAKVKARGLSMEDAERMVAELVLARPGIARAITRSDLLRNRLPDNEIEQRVRMSFDAERTGHVYLVPDPGWIQATDPADLAAMHGTPYLFDRAVPVAFWGLGLPQGRIGEPADPRDIAPTLARLARVQPPNGSSGRVLSQVVGPE